MSAKRYPRSVVKAAAKQMKPKGGASRASEPHQVVAVPESEPDFTAEDWLMLEDALHSAIARHGDLRRWALGDGDAVRAASHEVSLRDFEELLKKVKARRALKRV